MVSTIDITDVHFVSDFYQKNISNEEWNIIEKQKDSFLLISNSPGLEYLRYPGLVFSNEVVANIFYNQVYKQYENTYTPPRGNLTRFNNTIVVGIKPGNYRGDSLESAWLFGRSSEILHQAMMDFGIYPYFTNVYKSYYDEQKHEHVNDVYKEIVQIAVLNKHIYIKENLNIIFLGSYFEYDKLISAIGNEEKLKGMRIRMSKVWHPSYVKRFNKYNSWKKQLAVAVR